MKDSSGYAIEINFEDKNKAAVKELELVGFDKKMLEFGCSIGYVSKILKERGCSVTGIEIDGEAAKKAEAYCERVIVGDIENIDFNRQLGNEKFDVALFGDILEHLKDPKTILVTVKEFLNEKGYIVISIPNIAHWSIRLYLLCGKFDYHDWGILDDTHLRFFTKRSFINLLESSGYFVDSIDYVREEIDWIKINSMLKVKGISESAIKSLSNVLDDADAEAYQYIVKAFPSSESLHLEKISAEKDRLDRRIITLQEEIQLQVRTQLAVYTQQKDARIAQLQEEIAQLQEEIAQLQEELNRMLQLKSVKLHRKIEGVLSKLGIRQFGFINHAMDTFELLSGRKDKLTPPERMIFVGGGAGNFKEIGEEFIKYFIEVCDLKPNEKVLDVGCGIGRMAVPLTRYLDENGSYDGFDIVKEGIKWCKKKISRRYPNFRFQLADIFNKYYNTEGRYKAAEFKFPYENESFDFIFLTSVFTHMLPQDMENYFSEIARVLKKDGRCLITFFLLNEESLKLIDAKASTLDFQYVNEEHRIVDMNIPEAAVAYDEQFISGLFEKYELKIKEPVHYGSWCGRQDFLSYQDIIIGFRR